MKNWYRTWTAFWLFLGIGCSVSGSLGYFHPWNSTPIGHTHSFHVIGRAQAHMGPANDESEGRYLWEVLYLEECSCGFRRGWKATPQKVISLGYEGRSLLDSDEATPRPVEYVAAILERAGWHDPSRSVPLLRIHKDG